MSQLIVNEKERKQDLKHLLNRLVLSGLVIFPFIGMGFLTITVLGPSLTNPEAKFYSSSKGYPAKQRAQGEAISVETATVEKMSFNTALSAPGESVATQSIEMLPEVQGVIETVFVQEGDWVKAGTPLLQLEQASFLDELHIAQNNVANDNQNELALKSTYASDLSRLEANIERAKARVKNAEERLARAADVTQNRQESARRSARVQLETTNERLDKVRALAAQGVLSQVELLEEEALSVRHEHELFLATDGSLDSAAHFYNNRDYVIRRRHELEQALLALARAEEVQPTQLEKARLRLQTRTAQLREAERNLERTTLVAPTDGLISLVTVDEGEVLAPNSRHPAMMLNQNVSFEAYIDQAQLNKVVEGDIATLRLTAYPGEVFTGKVTRVNPTVETEATKQRKVGVDRQYTYSVLIEVENLQMPPGLQGYVQFGKSQRALMIPESSFMHLSGGEGMVMVMKDGRAVPRSVTVSALQDNQREVLSGLESGEKVILNPQAIEPNDRVIEKVS